MLLSRFASPARLCPGASTWPVVWGSEGSGRRLRQWDPVGLLRTNGEPHTRRVNTNDFSLVALLINWADWSTNMSTNRWKSIRLTALNIVNVVIELSAPPPLSSSLCALQVGPKGKVIGIDHIKELVDDSINNVKKDDPSLITSGRVKLIGKTSRMKALYLCFFSRRLWVLRKGCCFLDPTEQQTV